MTFGEDGLLPDAILGQDADRAGGEVSVVVLTAEIRDRDSQDRHVLPDFVPKRTCTTTSANTWVASVFINNYQMFTRNCSCFGGTVLTGQTRFSLKKQLPDHKLRAITSLVAQIRL